MGEGIESAGRQLRPSSTFGPARNPEVVKSVSEEVAITEIISPKVMEAFKIGSARDITSDIRTIMKSRGSLSDEMLISLANDIRSEYLAPILEAYKPIQLLQHAPHEQVLLYRGIETSILEIVQGKDIDKQKLHQYLGPEGLLAPAYYREFRGKGIYSNNTCCEVVGAENDQEAEKILEQAIQEKVIPQQFQPSQTQANAKVLTPQQVQQTQQKATAAIKQFKQNFSKAYETVMASMEKEKPVSHPLETAQRRPSTPATPPSQGRVRKEAVASAIAYGTAMKETPRKSSKGPESGQMAKAHQQEESRLAKIRAEKAKAEEITSTEQRKQKTRISPEKGEQGG